MQISEFMTGEHRACDVEFADVEKSVNKDDYAAAQNSFENFMLDTLKHFQKEEEVLFPAFEAASGNTMGPTQVMRMEHDQVRGLFDKMKVTLDEKNRDEFFSVADTLMILLQQHNMKEEQMLYTMCDRFLGAQADEIVEKMQAV